MKQDSLISARDSASTEVSGLEIAKPRVSFYTQYGKRMFDLAFAILLLPILLPIMLVIALGMAHKGKIIFGHRRVGRGGKEFTCYKFRTMGVFADKQLSGILASDPTARAEWERSHKLQDDPRVTRLGGVLRRTSLDELPQIWNVIKGDMSFVGPRPVTQDELQKYGAARSAYIAGRPGITGKWQVSGRNQISYNERIAIDVTYRSEERLSSDLILIAKTPLEVFAATGQ